MTDRKFRFNVIDALIIIVLIVAIAILAYVFVISDDTEPITDTHTVEYVMIGTSLNDTFRDAIHEGDQVFSTKDRSKVLGVVCAEPEVSVNVKEAFDYNTGEEVYPEGEGLIDVIITFRAEANKDAWGYNICDNYFLVNGSYSLSFGDVAIPAVDCVEVTVLD
ncbi:MAG: DUF4330 family protein [Clostridia bacterium]|nr:DUF4330 family protein [Clostridia bacterium]